MHTLLAGRPERAALSRYKQVIQRGRYSSLLPGHQYAVSRKDNELHGDQQVEREILIETPILIVGAGPVGTTLSLLLGRLHVPHLLVDKRLHNDALDVSPLQAHFISNRSMESRCCPIICVIVPQGDVKGSVFTFLQSYHSAELFQFSELLVTSTTM